MVMSNFNNRNSSLNNNLYNIFSQYLGMGSNPQQIFQNMIASNPQIQVALNQMQQSGLSSKDYVLQYAKQNNIDITPMINMLSQRGIRL